MIPCKLPRLRAPGPDALEKAIRNTTQSLLKTQYEEGYWWAELESNVSITSEYIMLYYLLGRSDPEKEQSMVKYLLNQQRANGSWGLYYGDEGNLSTTMEAYFALKLAGEDPHSAPLVKAKDYILRHGGIEVSPGVHQNLAGTVRSVRLGQGPFHAGRAGASSNSISILASTNSPVGRGPPLSPFRLF